MLEAGCPDVGRGHGRTTQAAVSPKSQNDRYGSMCVTGQVAAKMAKIMSLQCILNVLDYKLKER